MFNDQFSRRRSLLEKATLPPTHSLFLLYRVPIIFSFTDGVPGYCTYGLGPILLSRKEQANLRFGRLIRGLTHVGVFHFLLRYPVLGSFTWSIILLRYVDHHAHAGKGERGLST